MPPIMGAAAFLMAENIGVGLVGLVLLVQLLTKKEDKNIKRINLYFRSQNFT